MSSKSDQPRKITVASGDGIGPEIMDATLKILNAAKARIEIEEVRISGKDGNISDEAWRSIAANRVLLKGPLSHPPGQAKNLNVTLRKTLSLFANVRPCRSFAPFVKTNHPGLDMVIVRENEEDLFCAIEHRQTNDVYQCLRIVTRPGSERIVRFAFEFARRNGRRKVTCITNSHILKLTDGIFKQVFDEVGAEYSGIEAEHLITDTGAAKLVYRPESFDVIVTPNIYGDILSDVAAQLAGSVGMVGTANIGDRSALFEAIHGSAPKYEGLNMANPSGLITAARLMLSHLGQDDVVELIRNAWLRTLEDGIHTYDVHEPGRSRARVSTSDFANAVIERLGEAPRQLKLKALKGLGQISQAPSPRKPVRKELVGIDVFIEDTQRSPDELARTMSAATAATPELSLEMITSRGVKVWPQGHDETFMADHWRCRFNSTGPAKQTRLLTLLGEIGKAGIEVIKTENLYLFNGEPGFSRGQGQ